MKLSSVVGLAPLCLGLAAHAAEPRAVDPAVLAALQVDPARITVIDFFAEWCVSCHKELPLISAAHARADKKKVDFVGIDTDDSPQVAEAFQKSMREKGALSFRVVNDPQQALVRSFKPRGYPALYVLVDGKVVREHLGATANVDAVLEADLTALGAH